MASFSDREVAFLTGERRLGRLATIDKDGFPHLVPLGWTFDPEHGTIDISGHSFAATKKYRNAKRDGRVAFLVDDVLPPWRPRAVMVQGRAEALERDGDEALLRITPERIVSWGLDE